LKVRDRIEAGFEAWGRVMVRFRWVVIAIVLVFSGALISQIPKNTIDASTEGFLRPDDPILVVYNAFRDQFGRDDLVLITIHTDDLFDRDFLERLRDFHAELEESVPQLEDIDSLINARSTRGNADELIVEDLFEEWPETDAELEAIRALVLANPLLPDLVVSRDLTYTTVSLKLDTYSAEDGAVDLEGFDDAPVAEPKRAEERVYLTGAENNANMVVVREVMARYAAPDFEMFVSGSPVFTEQIGAGVSGDLRRFVVLSMLTSAFFLFLIFRRPSGTLLPMVVVLLSLLATMGIIPILGYQIQLPTQILPAFLMAVGIGDSVHILVILYQRLREGVPKDEAIAQALGHSGLAVAMTTLTTAGALASFAGSAMLPVANLGVLAPLGVILAFVYTVTLLPALLSVLPIRSDVSGARTPLAFLDRRLVAVGVGCALHPWRVAAVWSGVVALGALGASQLGFSHNPISWFREGAPIRVDTETINEVMRGAMSIDVLIDAGRENGLHDPALLNVLDEIKTTNAEVEVNRVTIGKTVSLVDVLKETNKALNENRASQYAVPQDPLLVAQELLLFENSGSDDLEEIVDSQFRVGRMTLKVPWVDAVAYPDFIEYIESDYAERVGSLAEVAVTGRVALLGRTFSAMIESMAQSYVIAFIVITPLMILLLASFKWGLVSMIPNLSPILITLGMMGAFAFPLDGFTLLIGSIAIGLAVDDTIHFLHNFQRYYDRSGDAIGAIRQTLQTTGQAMLLTTLVLCAGFFLFTLGTMQSTQNFGFLTGFALVVAFLADVTLVPAIIGLLTRRD
jgi:predicted RND superfamily exporter protein